MATDKARDRSDFPYHLLARHYCDGQPSLLAVLRISCSLNGGYADELEPVRWNLPIWHNSSSVIFFGAQK